MSLRECLALLLGTGPRGVGCLGLAARLLERPGSGLPESEQCRAFFQALESAPLALVSGIPGLGEAGKARILAAFELGIRYQRYRESGAADPDERASGPLRKVPHELRFEAKEWLGFVPVQRNGRFGEFCLVERGVRTHVNVDPVELFARLLALRPAAFYLFHNHPSGDLTPSSADIDLTRAAGDLGKSFGVRLLGHGIVSGRDSKWIVV